MNMVVLIGRLVRDPSYSEVETEKGKYHIASFYLAVPRNFNKGVNYIKITTFGKQADFARDYLTKGKRVAILGELMIGNSIICTFTCMFSSFTETADRMRNWKHSMQHLCRKKHSECTALILLRI